MSAQPGDVPLPLAAAKRPKGQAEPREGAWVPPLAPTIGSFYNEHRALVDARRAHLERMGMAAEHVEALRMPDLSEKPVPPPVMSETLPAVNQAEESYTQPKLPKLLGATVSLHDETEE